MPDPEKSTMENVSEQFRQVSGLPERTGDKPITDGEGSTVATRTEPEGGYGGAGETKPPEEEEVDTPASTDASVTVKEHPATAAPKAEDVEPVKTPAKKTASKSKEKS